jgi:phage N-6-adenine-methyltransferase
MKKNTNEYINSVLESKIQYNEDDEWETPKELYKHLCEKYKIYPKLDVCANYKNTKCYDWFCTPYGLTEKWLSKSPVEKVDVWCNPPHSKNKEFVKQAYDQWVKHNITIMMILPANALCTNYATNWIEPFAEYHPINRSYCKFLKNGQELDSSRNGYFVVIWRKTK